MRHDNATHRLSPSRVSTGHYLRVQQNPDDTTALRRLGDNLRALRESKGKSQDTLANTSSLHRTYIGAVERGERNPTYLTLKKYAAGLGISVRDLFEGLE